MPSTYPDSEDKTITKAEKYKILKDKFQCKWGGEAETILKKIIKMNISDMACAMQKNWEDSEVERDWVTISDWVVRESTSE